MSFDTYQRNTLQSLFGSSPPPANITGSPDSSAAASFLHALADVAAGAARESACGSVLAGHSNESDEYGDVPVWLGSGTFGAGHDQDALRALGLHSWLGRQVNVLRFQDETGLPYTFRPAPESANTEALRTRLDELADKVLFTIEGEEGVIMYMLLGKLPSVDGGWAGLLGIGIAADS